MGSRYAASAGRTRPTQAKAQRSEFASCLKCAKSAKTPRSPRERENGLPLAVLAPLAALAQDNAGIINAQACPSYEVFRSRLRDCLYRRCTAIQVPSRHLSAVNSSPQAIG